MLYLSTLPMSVKWPVGLCVLLLLIMITQPGFVGELNGIIWIELGLLLATFGLGFLRSKKELPKSVPKRQSYIRKKINTITIRYVYIGGLLVSLCVVALLQGPERRTHIGLMTGGRAATRSDLQGIAARKEAGWLLTVEVSQFKRIIESYTETTRDSNGHVVAQKTVGYLTEAKIKGKLKVKIKFRTLPRTHSGAFTFRPFPNGKYKKFRVWVTIDKSGKVILDEYDGYVTCWTLYVLLPLMLFMLGSWLILDSCDRLADFRVHSIWKNLVELTNDVSSPSLANEYDLEEDVDAELANMDNVYQLPSYGLSFTARWLLFETFLDFMVLPMAQITFEGKHTTTKHYTNGAHTSTSQSFTMHISYKHHERFQVKASSLQKLQELQRELEFRRFFATLNDTIPGVGFQQAQFAYNFATSGGRQQHQQHQQHQQQQQQQHQQQQQSANGNQAFVGQNHYSLLGIARSATQSEIQRAYRSKAFSSHPDRNPGDPSATERFQKVQHAYEVFAEPHYKTPV